MRRPRIDGGMLIAAAIAALTVILTLIALARLQPTSPTFGSDVTAPLTRLEVPLQRPTTSTTMPPPPPAVTVTTAPPATVGPGETFYPDCVTARAAGVTDLRRGQPGYRAQLDRDADGHACESPPVPPTTTTSLSAPPRGRVTPSQPVPAPTPARTTAATVAPPLTFVDVPPSISVVTPPTPTVATTAPAPPTTVPSTTTTVPTTTTIPLPRFTDCNQAAAAGLDLPLTPASPWWNPALDVDGDGLACEDDPPTPPPSTTTTLPTPPVDCVAAWDLGLAPILPNSPYWNPAWDPDGRGVACAVDPRHLDVSSTSSTTTLPRGDGR